MYLEKLKLLNYDEPSMLEAVESCDDPDVLTRGLDVSTIVRAGIVPIRARVGTVELSPSALANDQRSNCYGSNLVLSEALETTGITHYVAFANDHVFTIATDDESRAMLFDAHSPIFNGDITQAIHQRRPSSLKDDIATKGRSVIHLDTSQVATNAELKRPFEELVIINPWLSYGPEARLHNHRPRSLDQSRYDHTLVTTVYESSLGRKIVELRSSMHRNVEHGDIVGAAAELHEMSGLYPEVDPRNRQKLQRLGKIAIRLALLDKLDLAEQVIEDVRASFAINPNPNLVMWPADQHRKIAVELRSKQYIQTAIEEYDRALAQYPKNTLLLGKLATAKKVAAVLSK